MIKEVSLISFIFRDMNILLDWLKDLAVKIREMITEDDDVPSLVILLLLSGTLLAILALEVAYIYSFFVLISVLMNFTDV